jgi:hypothetical protein
MANNAYDPTADEAKWYGKLGGVLAGLVVSALTKNTAVRLAAPLVGTALGHILFDQADKDGKL